MMGLIRPVITACLVCGMLGAGPAAAEGGRITFSGAVVVSTCATGPSAGEAASIPGRSWVACDEGRSARAGRADVSRYRSSLVPLDGVEVAGNPLLGYFIGYMPSTERAKAGLVTRIYE
jgi:hypothetical protein